MGFIKDTCVFIEKIKVGSEIVNIVRHCKSMNKELCVTDYVLDEIPPGKNVKEKDPEGARTSEGLFNSLDKCVNNGFINVFCVKGNNKYKKNYDSIRNRFYRQYSAANLRERMKNGKCTKQEANKLKRKDCGECSCIAVAMEHPDKYVIVTEDKGKIFVEEEIKLFQIYEKSHNIKVWNYDVWAKNTGYDKAQKEFIS